MNNGWYEIVDPGVPVTQGDIIFDCPLITWKSDLPQLDNSDNLEAAIDAIRTDVVVLTQACDLENNKVENVILCPHISIDTYKELWETEMKSKGETPTSRSWKSHCNGICSGSIWNLTMLNNYEKDENKIDIRIVDFHEVYTIPRTFLESMLEQSGRPRFRLLPPYREHLSQSFARFFMRVGLPIPIDPAW